MANTKHAKIRDEIREAILSGKYRPGQRLPTEAELVRLCSASRPTVARALRDLQHEGLVARRAGSGTYVSENRGAQGHLFGLIIPRLGETEIFDPICKEVARYTQEHYRAAVIWATAGTEASIDLERKAWQACQLCIERRVAGVFFAPLEWTPNDEEINDRIVQAFDAAKIPVVLVDRDLYCYPRRSRYDRVGIDNRAAGHVVANHLIKCGCEQIGFLSKPHSAETVKLRLAGYRDALSEHGISVRKSWVVEGDPGDVEFVRGYLKESDVQGVVCANDFTAAHLMQTLDQLGIRIPQEMKVIGIDDVKYASLLKVPLTTLHQPCKSIGAAAVDALVARIADPTLPPRDILFHCELIVRESCGERFGQLSRLTVPLSTTKKASRL